MHHSLREIGVSPQVVQLAPRNSSSCDFSTLQSTLQQLLPCQAARDTVRSTEERGSLYGQCRFAPMLSTHVILIPDSEHKISIQDYE
jgi:hypothetical protein